MSRLQPATCHRADKATRNYTMRLLDQTKAEDWFRQPPGGVSHIAWQVGHLAMAEYRLALDRIRGPLSHDTVLISEDFLRLFGRPSGDVKWDEADPTYSLEAARRGG